MYEELKLGNTGINKTGNLKKTKTSHLDYISPICCWNKVKWQALLLPKVKASLCHLQISWGQDRTSKTSQNICILSQLFWANNSSKGECTWVVQTKPFKRIRLRFPFNTVIRSDSLLCQQCDSQTHHQFCWQPHNMVSLVCTLSVPYTSWQDSYKWSSFEHQKPKTKNSGLERSWATCAGSKPNLERCILPEYFIIAFPLSTKDGHMIYKCK